MSSSEHSLVVFRPLLAAEGADITAGSSVSVSTEHEVVELENGKENEDYVLGLATQDCFTVYRTLAESRPLKSRTLVSYELEDCVPIDADRLAFESIATSNGVLYVAADGDSVRDFVGKLQDQGRHAVAVTPVVFLAIAKLRKADGIGANETVVWRSGNFVDVIEFQKGAVAAWRWCALDVDAIKEAMASLPSVSEADSPVTLIGFSQDLLEQFAFGQDPRGLEHDQLDFAKETARAICEGTEAAPLDLRNGPLEPASPFRSIAGSLRIFAVSLLLMQVAVLAAAWLRAQAYQQKTDHCLDQQQQAYRSVFPDGPIPVGIQTRLHSEHRQLSGMKGVGDEDVPSEASVLPVTHKLLSAFPTQANVRFEVSDVRLAADTIVLLDGTVKSYADLETIAERLRSAGFDVPAVASEKTENGTTLRLENIRVTQPKAGDRR